MTYGENAGVIRDELTALLGHHRIQQRIGGKGLPSSPESTTQNEREELGRSIRRYRFALLVWCSQALRSMGDKTEPPRERSEQTAVEQLESLIASNLVGGPGDLRLLDLLTDAPRFELIAGWQRAARAAAVGEHDFSNGVDRGRLSAAQIATVTRDATLVIQALTVLDTRYALIPGWKPLLRRGRLVAAAREVLDSIPSEYADASVDDRGRRPRPVHMSSEGARGLHAAVIAQHNLAVTLSSLPTALNLRRVMSLQALASREAARRTPRSQPDLADAFLERATVYRQLLSNCRNLAGLVGDGGDAVIESHRMLAALRDSQVSARSTEPEPFEVLRRLFAAVDARTAVLLERGLADRNYFVSVTVPRLGTDRVGGVVQPRLRYMPADTQPGDPILPLVRSRLRPAPTFVRTGGPLTDRAQLERALQSQSPTPMRCHDSAEARQLGAGRRPEGQPRTR